MLPPSTIPPTVQLKGVSAEGTSSELLILSFTLGLTTAAQSGFVNNKSTWDSLSWEVKQGYAMGQFDEIVMVLTSDGAKETKRKDGLNECAIRIKLTAKDMKRMKLVDEIVKEPLGGAHKDRQQTFTTVSNKIVKSYEEFKNLSPKELVDKRMEKYSQMGVYQD